MTFDSVSGRAAARVSARVRRKLNIERITREVGPLETLADALRRLDWIGVWALGGMVTGVAANSAVRSVEVWLRGKEDEASFEVVEGLRDDFRTVCEERDQLARELELAKLELARLAVR